MTNQQYGERKSTAKLETVAKRIVYVILAFDVVLMVVYGSGYIPLLLAIIVHWAGALGIVGAVHTVEDDVHPDQRGWWTLLTVAFGGFGLLAWLRHLDKEH